MTGTDTRRGDDTRRADGESELPRLSAAEDAELRQLAWFAKAGQLSEQSQARLAELRDRDRRDTIRDPRPDPGAGSLQSAPRFGSEASGPASTCPNCGSGSLKPVGTSRSCSYCGFSQRQAPDLPAVAEAVVPVASEAEPRPLGTIESESFRDLLLTAARGGPAVTDGRELS